MNKAKVQKLEGLLDSTKHPKALAPSDMGDKSPKPTVVIVTTTKYADVPKPNQIPFSFAQRTFFG